MAKSEKSRVRKARRSLPGARRNATAEVMEPPQASRAWRAWAGSAPVFWATMPAASEAGMWRKGTTWQRETIVGSTDSRVRPRRIITTSSAGSSSVFKNALAALAPS